MKVATVTNLQQLRLEEVQYQGDGYAPLAGLRSLRLLALRDHFCIPDNLSQLTWLEALSLIETSCTTTARALQASSILLEALPRLTRLGHLALTSIAGVDSPPLELAGLGRLHTFVWLDGDPSTPADAVLPAGPWLGSMRRMGAPAHLLANSSHLLGGAPCLEHLAVIVDSEHAEPAHTQDILRSAVYWPSLRKLSLASTSREGGGELPAALVAAAFQAQCDRPSLSIDLSPPALADLWDGASYC